MPQQGRGSNPDKTGSVSPPPAQGAEQSRNGDEQTQCGGVSASPRPRACLSEEVRAFQCSWGTLGGGVSAVPSALGRLEGSGTRWGCVSQLRPGCRGVRPAGERRGNKTDQFPWRKQAVPLRHREFSLAETKLCPRCLCRALPGWLSARRGASRRCGGALLGRARGCHGGGGAARSPLPGECRYLELLQRYGQRAHVGPLGPAGDASPGLRILAVFVGVLCVGWMRQAWISVAGCSVEKCQR